MKENYRRQVLAALGDFLTETPLLHLSGSCHDGRLRRALAALETRFPLVTERSLGQVRWKLMDGYRRSQPLAFSSTELMALTFSRELLKPLDGTQVKASLDSALHKVETALPPEGAAYVRHMHGQFSVGLGAHKTYRQHRHTIDQLNRSIAQKRTVQMRYYSASQDRTGRREVDPYRLWYADGGLYLIAYCHRRREVRMFAVERIHALTITNHPYQLLLGFDVEAYVHDALVVMRGKPITVELLFDRQTSAWAKDRKWHPSQEATLFKNGQLMLTLRVADTRELLGWILHFGSGVRVRKPESLRERVQQEARKIFEQG